MVEAAPLELGQRGRPHANKSLIVFQGDLFYLVCVVTPMHVEKCSLHQALALTALKLEGYHFTLFLVGVVPVHNVDSVDTAPVLGCHCAL